MQQLRQRQHLDTKYFIGYYEISLKSVLRSWFGADSCCCCCCCWSRGFLRCCICWVCYLPYHTRPSVVVHKYKACTHKLLKYSYPCHVGQLEASKSQGWAHGRFWWVEVASRPGKGRSWELVCGIDHGSAPHTSICPTVPCRMAGWKGRSRTFLPSPTDFCSFWPGKLRSSGLQCPLECCSFCSGCWFFWFFIIIIKI